MANSLKRFIWVTFQRKGFHRYPNAPQEVEYLATRHRHLFKFTVKIEVFHDDREIEFHMFQNKIESWYDSGALELNYKSCEMMADDLADAIRREYGVGDDGNTIIVNDLNGELAALRDLVITVSEDGECGSECHYTI